MDEPERDLALRAADRAVRAMLVDDVREVSTGTLIRAMTAAIGVVWRASREGKRLLTTPLEDRSVVRVDDLSARIDAMECELNER